MAALTRHVLYRTRSQCRVVPVTDVVVSRQMVREVRGGTIH